MNRLGFRHDNLARTLPAIAKSEHLAIDAVYTHFATADEPEHPAFGQQRERFEKVLATLPSLGITPQYRHAANSAALLRDERVWYDFVRPGLLLYGIVPPPLAAMLPLRPALSLHSRIVHVKGMRAGEGTGYGLHSVVDSRHDRGRPAGYADGLDRRMAGRTFMLVRGKRVPVVGSVCMDMTMIDVTGMDVSTGDEVVIVGQQDGEEIGMREIAAAMGTIRYQFLCRVGTRIERVNCVTDVKIDPRKSMRLIRSRESPLTSLLVPGVRSPVAEVARALRRNAAAGTRSSRSALCPDGGRRGGVGQRGRPILPGGHGRAPAVRRN